MKKLVAVFFALQSVTAFAEIDLFSALRAEGIGTMHFSGEGVYSEISPHEKGKYLVTLKVKPLDTTRTHLDWHVNFDGREEHYAMVLEQNHELITVHTPTSEASQHDFSTYVKAGYGYVAFGANASKQFIFLNYLHGGDRYDQHLLIQRDDKGRFVITHSGTLGNDKDGLDKIWHEHVTQMN